MDVAPRRPVTEHTLPWQDRHLELPAEIGGALGSLLSNDQPSIFPGDATMWNRIFRPILLAIVVLASLFGCAGVQQREVDEITSKHEAMMASDSLVMRLEGKVRLRATEELTLMQLSDDSFPDASQKESILAWDRNRTQQESETLRLFDAKGIPGNSAIVRQFYGASKGNRLALYQGAISFGEFNRTQKKLFEIQMQLIGKLNAANAQQARAAWNDALKSMDDSFQARQRSTVNTNCYSYGNSVSCTSR